MSTTTATTTMTAAEAEAEAATALNKTDPLPTTLPLVSWKHGMARKASGTKSISVWFDLALTLDGRDKITKLLQYISRFLAWYYSLATNSKNIDAAERFANLKVALTNSRKAFRLGRTMMELQKVYGMNLLHSLIQQQQQQQKASANSITLIGTALKSLGLAGFWAGDNVNFLSSSGFLDNYQITNAQQRLQQRKSLATRAGIFANRSYFMGAVAGLVVNARAYLSFRRETHERLLEIKNDNNNTQKDSMQKNASSSSSNDEGALLLYQKDLDEAQEKQFVLFVALVKSCCDVLAFSNNPGVDLWEKYHGRKLNEGVHCVAGMMSALTVLYNTFPNNNKK